MKQIAILRHGAVTNWWFDDDVQASIARAHAERSGLPFVYGTTHLEVPPGDFITDAAEFSDWLGNKR